MKMLRKNVLVDTGERVNMLGSKLIETPAHYRPLNSVGKIVDVAAKCQRLSAKDVGKKVLLGLVRHADSRIPPADAKRFGLKPHWHFICHENAVQLVIE